MWEITLILKYFKNNKNINNINFNYLGRFTFVLLNLIFIKFNVIIIRIYSTLFKFYNIRYLILKINIVGLQNNYPYSFYI